MALIGTQGEGPVKNLQGEETLAWVKGYRAAVVVRVNVTFKDIDFR